MKVFVLFDPENSPAIVVADRSRPDGIRYVALRWVHAEFDGTEHLDYDLKKTFIGLHVTTYGPRDPEASVMHSRLYVTVHCDRITSISLLPKEPE